VNIEPTTRQYILSELAREFRFNGGELASAIGAVAEHIRSACALMAMGDEGARLDSSSVVKICRVTHRRLCPVFKEFLLNGDRVSNELSKLDMLGDVVKINASRALIGPARRILIDESHALLIGGGPVSIFATALRGSIEVAGRSRILVGSIAETSLSSLPFQRLEDWLELERDDMVEWANTFVRNNLNPGRNILVPDDLVLWSHFRWIPIGEIVEKKGVYLARRRISRFGNLSDEYYLIRLRKNVATQKIDALLPIERECARKFQGALRHDKEVREKFRFSVVREGIVELSINHPLAKCHEKILALGWHVDDDGGFGIWPKKFEFSKKLIPLLERAFNLIGYNLVEERRGNNGAK